VRFGKNQDRPEIAAGGIVGRRLLCASRERLSTLRGFLNRCAIDHATDQGIRAHAVPPAKSEDGGGRFSCLSASALDLDAHEGGAAGQEHAHGYSFSNGRRIRVVASGLARKNVQYLRRRYRADKVLAKCWRGVLIVPLLS